MALVLTALWTLSAAAQEPVWPVSPAGEKKAPRLIPLSPFLEVLSAADLRWRPDWPGDFPPDAFSVKGGRALSIILTAGEMSFTLRRDREGRLREFPLFFDGAFIPVRADYDGPGRLLRLSAGPAGDSLVFDFPENFLSPGVADPVRVSLGGTWYFVVIQDAGAALFETWYDQGGNFTAWYRTRIQRDGASWRIRSLESRGGEPVLREDYDFDNDGHITAVNSLKGEFSARYRSGRPVYWDRIPAAETPPKAEAAAVIPDPSGSFILQWDERGLLRARRPQTEDGAGEFRYDYETGGRGDWTRRQDVEMIGREGIRFPLFRGSYERRISYLEE
jgi:hypothetical protein